MIVCISNQCVKFILWVQLKDVFRHGSDQNYWWWWWSARGAGFSVWWWSCEFSLHLKSFSWACTMILPCFGMCIVVTYCVFGKNTMFCGVYHGNTSLSEDLPCFEPHTVIIPCFCGVHHVFWGCTMVVLCFGGHNKIVYDNTMIVWVCTMTILCFVINTMLLPHFYTCFMVMLCFCTTVIPCFWYFLPWCKDEFLTSHDKTRVWTLYWLFHWSRNIYIYWKSKC